MAAIDTLRYDDRTPRLFFLATIFWGVVGMLVGALSAAMLFLPDLNLAPYLTFGRLRPLHTNAVIFAFCCNIIFGGVYHSMQRLLKTRLWSDWASKIHFWGWQLLIVAGAVALVTGHTQGKEYAELPWILDIVIAGLWVLFAVNFFGTIAIRRERHLYVAIWFYVATIVAVAILHIGNSAAILRALRAVGTPCTDGELHAAGASIAAQAKVSADEIVLQQGPEGLADKEIVALTAYLQRLGTDIKWRAPARTSLTLALPPVPEPAPAVTPGGE